MKDDKFLDGKHILFLVYKYFDYHIHIKKTIEAAGGTVDAFSVWKYSTNREKFVFTFLRHLNKKLFTAYNRAYSRSILKAINGRKYDYVLAISGDETISLNCSYSRV